MIIYIYIYIYTGVFIVATGHVWNVWKQWRGSIWNHTNNTYLARYIECCCPFKYVQHLVNIIHIANAYIYSSEICIDRFSKCYFLYDKLMIARQALFNTKNKKYNSKICQVGKQKSMMVSYKVEHFKYLELARYFQSRSVVHPLHVSNNIYRCVIRNWVWVSRSKVL